MRSVVRALAALSLFVLASCSAEDPLDRSTSPLTIYIGQEACGPTFVEALQDATWTYHRPGFGQTSYYTLDLAPHLDASLSSLPMVTMECPTIKFPVTPECGPAKICNSTDVVCNLYEKDPASWLWQFSRYVNLGPRWGSYTSTYGWVLGIKAADGHPGGNGRNFAECGGDTSHLAFMFD
jgi:hypothetical protein